MIIHGREIGFLRTVKTTCDLAEMCPKNDITKLQTLFDGNDVSKTQKASARFISIMSDGYEMRKAYDTPGYEPKPLTVDEILYLSEEEFRSLFMAAVDAFKEGGAVTVEAEPVKQKKTNGQ